MGVRGLQTYLEKYCPEARYLVHIPKIVREYSESTGRPVEIVVDAYSWIFQWICVESSLIGIGIQEVIHRLTEFVEAFRKIDVKLVFFFDGITVQKKRETWINRRKRSLKDMEGVFDILEKETCLQAVNQLSSFSPALLEFLFYATLKYQLKCEVYNSVFECDEEIIKYANDRNCFAIFGQDTDFIVSHINAVVLLAANFNVTHMTTYLCDRRKLAALLNIRVHELPLFATLLGNDFMPFDELQNFHCDVTNTPRGRKNVSYVRLMPAVGNYVRRLPSGPIENALEQISKDVFGTTSKCELVKSSYESYSPKFPVRRLAPTDNWSRIIFLAEKLHRNSVNPCIIWSVLKEQMMDSCVAPEDLRKINDSNANTSLKPSCTVTRALRSRLYGLLLLEYEYSTVTVMEWCPENLRSFEKPVYVTPSKPKVLHPGLLSLWRNDESEAMIRTKWKLFVHSVSSRHTDLEKWCNLDPSLVLATASLCYLLEENYVQQWEVLAFIGTIATFSLYDRQKIMEISCEMPNYRAIHLNTTYIMTFNIVHALFATSGFPQPSAADNIKCLNFEAKLFQKKYKTTMDLMMVRRPQLINHLCEGDSDCIEKFYQMEDLILKNGYPPTVQSSYFKYSLRTYHFGVIDEE